MSIIDQTHHKRKPTRIKIPAEDRKVIKFLASHIYKKDFGEAYGDYHIGRTTHDHLKMMLTGTVPSGIYPRQHSLTALYQHCLGLRTIYYTSRNYCSKVSKWGEYIIIGIDIDVLHHKKLGSAEGGKKFAKLLQKYFPGAYFEKSTNGNGQHGFIRCYVGDLTNQQINAILAKFERWLIKLAETEHADIEGIEIQGTCPEFVWEYGKLVSLKQGKLLKVPREILRREDEFINTALIDINKLADLVKDAPQPTQKKKSGSISGTFIQNEQVEGCKPGGYYHQLATTLLNGEVIRGKYRRTADAKALAPLLMILNFCTVTKPWADGAMPFERIKAIWIMLQDEIGCQKWDAYRYASMRDWLSDHGYVDWIDEHYTPGIRDENYNMVQKGECCKWKISESLITLIQTYENKTGRTDERVSLSATNSELPVLIESIEVVRPICVLNFDNFKQYQDNLAIQRLQEYERQQEILDNLYSAA